jgi:hypothetical protein
MSSNVSLVISEKNVQKDNKHEQQEMQEQIQKHKKEQEQKISLYIDQLTEQQKIVLNIAKEHLATSFCIEKSLGYLNWLKNNNNNSSSS